MKVLQVISGNDIGGGLKHVLNICKSNNNIKSSIYFIGEGEGKKYTNGIPWNCSSIKDVLKGDLNKFIENEKFDMINFHGAKANFVYGIIHNRIKIPSVVTIHSDYRYDFLNCRIKQILYLPLVKHGLNKYENYICASDFIKNIMVKNKFKGKFYTTFNGIDINERKIYEKNLKLKLNIPDEAFLFICVARLHPVKNHKTLIDSFKKMENNYKDSYLLLLGDGPLEEELKEYAKDIKNIRFLGYKSNTWDYFNISNVNILVSCSEGGEPPIVILEGGLKKLPIIASEFFCTDEAFKESGYLVNCNSVDEIYEKMRLLYLNRINAKMFGQNLYKLVINKYSLQAFGDRYFKIYKSILNGEKSE